MQKCRIGLLAGQRLHFYMAKEPHEQNRSSEGTGFWNGVLDRYLNL